MIFRDRLARRGERWARALISAGLVALLQACQEQPQQQSTQISVFGTLVEVVIVTRGDAQAAQARQAVAAIDRELQAMHRDLHAWKPGPLVEVNQALASGQAAAIDAPLANLIQDAAHLSGASDGLFDPAIGGLVRLWGFHTDDYPVRGPQPDAAQIQAWVSAAPSIADLHIEGGMLRSDNPHVQLDFGGFAKGVAVDRAMQILRQHQLEHAIVNAGGDLRAIGNRDGRGQPWRVAVRHPLGGWNSEQAILAGIETHADESVFTSGNYERYREHQSERWPHILDPRTGQPVQHVASATVIADTGARADAAATALVVAGVKDWRRIARQMGIEQAMLVDQNGTVYLTAAMQTRMQFSAPPPAQIVIVD